MGNAAIADYGLLADGRSAALVDRRGSIDWWCPERFDAPSVFCRLLDSNGGHWSIQPTDDFETRREYLSDSLVLRTVFTTAYGEASVTDGLVLEPGSRGHLIGRRSPGVLVRVVEGGSGTVAMAMSYYPRLEYGSRTAYLVWRDGTLVATAGPTTLTMTTPVPLTCSDVEATARFTVGPGERKVFVLAHRPTYHEGSPAGLDARDPLGDTVEGWRSWANLHSYPGCYPELVRQNALVLQGLTYQPSGAVVAAVTTSLPERIGGDCNYDYRYAWLRDFSLTLRALWVAACPDEANRLFGWVASAVGQVGDEPVPIMFGVEGERDLTERRIETLRGYADSLPVRVGNEAWRQRQLDVLGEVLDAAWQLRDYLDPMPPEVRDLLRSLADQAATSWRDPDAGMWESRDADRHYLSSKVLCWAALDRAILFGDRLGDAADLARWAAARDEARKTILRDGWNAEVGAYTGAFGSDKLDASVLVMPIVGILPATDERMRATIALIEERLSDGGLLRRWDTDPATFTLCSFWLVRCLVLAGERDRAAAMFERIAGTANDLGLFAEQFDPATGAHLGNFPQAFSHIGLVIAAWDLTAAPDAVLNEGES
ncbi:glycoside hydrolase family 15 protein [Plantactinospora sp. S1510]|uniref:Glycoside hydrolase family 15 protein n=1 Tax=Plantactinospora alkalitolerans TaxID=2789879 RepID=A0ABS0H5P7_9ACTN|nr:glycoside hydrolase family 15 protein [Plantactinospora alkalitolerans]MBF9133780.1 glycoside hydrolase family 15 protein [Plantactinospora alkalitolerans]